MIRAKVYRSAWGDLWLVDIYEEDEGSVGDGEFLSGGSHLAWEHAMQWANAEVVRRRKAAAWRRATDRLNELAATLKRMGVLG